MKSLERFPWPHVVRMWIASAAMLGMLASATAVGQTSSDNDRSAQHTSTPADHIDLLYFGKAGPLFIRLHPLIAGDSCQATWNRYVETIFQQLDTDHSGRLSTDEARAAPTATELAGAGVLSTPDGRTPTESLLDSVELASDGIPPAAFADYFKRLGVNPIFVDLPPPRVTVEDVTSLANERDFGLMDTSGDRRLSPRELMQAYATLQKFDSNDDEFIAASELPRVQVDRPIRASNASKDTLPEFVQLSPNAEPDTVRYLLAHYGRQDTQVSGLTALEIGLDHNDFGRRDRNRDGLLDGDELVRLIRDPAPALEFVLRVGEGDAAVESRNEAVHAQAAVRQPSEELAQIVAQDVLIEVVVDPGDGLHVEPDQYARDIFKRSDVDGNRYIEYDEARRLRNFRSTFDLMDRDRDGKVFEHEVLTYVVHQAELARTRVVLTITDQGRNLFEILDGNRDSLLTSRELASAANRLATWDTDGDGATGHAEVPHQFRLSLAMGQPNLLREYRSPRRDAVPVDAPRWFRKMDRNEDGELSRREFLGTAQRFAEFDTNRDGFIEPAEARAAGI